MNVAAISIEVRPDLNIRICSDGSYNSIDWDSGSECELGENFRIYEYKNDTRTPVLSMYIDKSPDDKYILRLTETRNYYLELSDPSLKPEDTVRFQNENNKNLKLYNNKNTLRFQFVNYLGRSKISFDRSDVPLIFEVVPDKMGYEDDYIVLTEEIAEKCADLLIEYSGSTSSVFSQTEDTQETLLEQFIFLRQFCYSQNLYGLFTYIKRNPDKLLVSSEEFRPFGTGRPSSKFYTSPFSKGRMWSSCASADGHTLSYPQQVAVVRKYDSYDTPANRFILFALRRFDELCEKILSLPDAEALNKQAECFREAGAIHKILEEILCDGFWDDVGVLDVMPQNNQVLQKREGYSQIFAACSMIDLALQLDWKGKDDVYEGEAKNVALLYEYWLFFELFEIIKSINGCKLIFEENEGFNNFISFSNSITLTLNQNSKSCQCFELSELNTRVNLYYNRTFSRNKFITTLYEGSYSRPFRPDYTIAVFPMTYSSEKEAVKARSVNYIHFDAKYRITDLTNFIGSGKNEEEELDEDKADSITNTYKRGDLLKMHTYNDAIRKTVGSYVLYPGDNKVPEKFEIYDEILPGVGAFAMKPSIKEKGESVLRGFIEEVITFNSRPDTRMNRINYYTSMVLSEPGDSKVCLSEKNEKIILGYIKKTYYDSLCENGLLKNDSQFLFYFYAINGTNVYSHHRELFDARYFTFFLNDIITEQKYRTEPVLCEILEHQLVSRKDLVGKLQKQGYDTSEDNHNADFYYMMNVKVVSEKTDAVEISVSEVNSLYGNDTYSPHSPKLLMTGDLYGCT